jgi:hypothetical protein
MRFFIILFLVGLFLLQAISALEMGRPTTDRSNLLGRRSVLQRVAGTLAGGTLVEWINPWEVQALESVDSSNSVSDGLSDSETSEGSSNRKGTTDFQTYRVITDASSALNPSIKSVQVRAEESSCGRK